MVLDEKMMGFWYSPQAYQCASGLPVLKSLRMIVASLIRDRIVAFGTQTVLSLGIGTGKMYEELLGDELRCGSLKVLGIDSSAVMLERCAEGLPIPAKSLPRLRIPTGQEIVLAQQSVLDDFGIGTEAVDIVEAVLILHHIAHRDELEDIVRRVYSVLKQGGIFIFGDIDLSLGAYIEHKERRLKAKYVSVERDLELGVFVCKDIDGETRLIPILDRNVESDRQVIDYVVSESLVQLEKEASLYGTPETREVVEVEIDSVMRGGELNRSLEEWRDICLTAFGQDSVHQAVKPDEIRKQFPEVLDRPFVLIVQKGKESSRVSLRAPESPQVAELDAKRIEETLSVKAGLLCWGIRPDANAGMFYREQNPYLLGKSGTVGVHLVLDGLTSALVSMSHEFNRHSPYHLLREGDEWYIARDGHIVISATPISMPQWYGKTTSRNTPMTDVFLFEGYHYFHIAYEGCDLFLTGKQCKFCSTGRKWHRIDPRDVGEVVEAAYLENPEGHVCLGGGTRWAKDKGSRYFTRCVSEIRKRVPSIPIWIEMVPPDKDEDIQLMIDAGATSFSFNIEVWDDEIRSQVCPGKSTICKERYLEALRYVNTALGPNKSGSILIVGLEPMGRTIEGIKALIEAGVKPSVAPFKPWDGAVFQSRAPASPEEVIEVSRITARLMREHNVDPRQNQGCNDCHGCAVEDDYFEFVFGP